MPSVLAIFAHPDDIEFIAAGTLLQLKKRGWDTHYFNLSAGSGGSVEYNAAKTRSVRLREAKNAAKLLGAKFYPPIADDLQILYETSLLRRVASVVRAAKPTIVLTHSPQDYMEDHMNSCRLAVTASFAHGIPNFVTTPRRAAFHDDVTVYHAMPLGLRDPLRQRIAPGQFVDTTSVYEVKLQALAAHRSQQNWLTVSQGENSYLRLMEAMSLELGSMSKKFTHAEGWRRHLHHGFSGSEVDPLADALGKDCLINKSYEAGLNETVK